MIDGVAQMLESVRGDGQNFLHGSHYIDYVRGACTPAVPVLRTAQHPAINACK
jgi:hypothetical protein